MDNNLPAGFALDNPDGNVPAGFQLDGDDDESVVRKYQQLQATHGGAGQQAIAGLEGLASAATFGLSTGLETAMGVDPADIRARREANPGTHMLGQATGLIGSLAVPVVGAGKLLVGAGNLATKAVGLGAAESLAGRIGAGAVAAGVENAAFQAGDEISKMLSLDPHQSVETALTNVGISGLFGSAIGGGVGGVSSLWKVSAAPKLAKAIDDFKIGNVDESVSAAAGLSPDDKGIIEGLKALKPNANEIRAAADELGAPLLESQISASKRIQDIDSMLSQSPSPTGVARQQLVQKGFDAADNAVKETLETAAPMSQVDVGKALQDSLTSKFEAQYAPLKELYALRKQSTEYIPLSPVAKRVISANIKKLENYKFTGSGARNVGDFILKNMDSLETIDDLQRISTEVNNQFRMTAPHAVGEVVEKLRNLEEATIIRAAKQMAKENPAMAPEVLRLIDENKALKASYKAFREEIGEFGAVLGKKRIRGPGDFLEFIDGMNPEDMAKKLFNRGNSTFAAKMAKQYPDEFKLLAGLEKQKLVPIAPKSGRINWHSAVKEIFNDKRMPPEIRKLIFSPDELKKLSAAKTYIEAMPQNVNPSGSSITEEAWRFYSSPYSAAKSSIRDYGLGKLMTHLVNKGDEQALYNSVFPAIAESVAKGETSPSALKSAVNYSLAVVKGEKQIYKASQALLGGTRTVLPSSVIDVSDSAMEKLDKKVAEFQDDPSELLSMGGETSHYMPAHAVAMAETAGRVIQYLADSKPKSIRPSPLDEDLEPSKDEMDQYKNKLALADKPLSILQKISDNTLLPDDVAALVAMYPDLYAKISQSITNEIIEVTSKGETVPYNLKQGLSLFLGQALDSTLSPLGIQAAQASFLYRRAPDVNTPMKKNTSKLNEMPDQFRTSLQASQQRRAEAKQQ